MHVGQGLPNKVNYRPPDMIDHRTLDDIYICIYIYVCVPMMGVCVVCMCVTGKERESVCVRARMCLRESRLLT